VFEHFDPVAIASASVAQVHFAVLPGGREVAVIEKSHEWIKVFANVDKELNITGWILDKGVVRANTPKGDSILFGEAVDSEAQASQRAYRVSRSQRSSRLPPRPAPLSQHVQASGCVLAAAVSGSGDTRPVPWCASSTQ